MGGVIPKIKIKRFKQLITGSRIKGLKGHANRIDTELAIKAIKKQYPLFEKKPGRLINKHITNVQASVYEPNTTLKNINKVIKDETMKIWGTRAGVGAGAIGVPLAIGSAINRNEEKQAMDYPKTIIKEALFRNIISKFSIPKIKRVQPPLVHEARPWDKEIGESQIGLPKELLPNNIKGYKVLDDVGDGHLYLVKNNKGENFMVDNENFWDSRDPKQISVTPTKRNQIGETPAELASYTQWKNELTATEKSRLKLKRISLDKSIKMKMSGVKTAMKCPRAIIKTAGIKTDIAAARRNTNTNPSEKQIEAENYKKGSFQWNGLTIKIENPRGSTRSGTSGNGKEWSIVMKYDYGYLASGQDGRDGDKIDIFIGDNPDSQLVFVIDQMFNGKFDEHKCVLGALTKEQAKKTYLSNYEKGWTGLGSISSLTVEQFKEWSKNGNAKKPLEGQSVKVAIITGKLI